MHLSDKRLLRKRAIIEAIINQLKNMSQIEHARHRCPTSFVVHLIAGLIAYSHQDKKTGPASRSTRSPGCLSVLT